MFRIITVPVLVVLTLVLVSFALSNREPVVLGLFPLPYELSLPMFIPVLVACFLGLLAGGFTVWVSAGKHRRKAKESRKQADELARQVLELKAELAKRPPSPAPKAALLPPSPVTPNASLQQVTANEQSSAMGQTGS